MRILLAVAVVATALAGCYRVDETGPTATAQVRATPGPAATPAPAQPPARPVVPAPEALTDAAISGRILAELATDPRMAGADVSIHTDKGVVVLSGTVSSQEQTGIASAHAQRQDGVMRVDNQLRPALS